MLSAEKELRVALARFAAARIEHDVLPTGITSRALEDATRGLCALTGTRTAEDALHEADTLIARHRARRAGAGRGGALVA
ncbi:hypothetical protein SZN_34512 [Streptomyces zinciresistens K42]|uniref:DUF5133 domain-containing protein n=2 Tax=Streptomyces TaxID=1883 RepID=G2GMZ7_9ACTN|nr:hypothetical protein SZN_34512 [Streptomyces zinciresistens K42]